MSTEKRDGKATTIKETFGRETSVTTTIQADPAVVWALLTNAADFPRWNSTVVSLQGEIKAGEHITLKSILDEKRTFKLKVKELEPQRRMIWGDSQGNRVYTLTKGEGGTVTFTMTEKIGGLFFPLYARYIPPFDEVFEKFAADLKKEAETIERTGRHDPSDRS